MVRALIAFVVLLALGCSPGSIPALHSAAMAGDAAAVEAGLRRGEDPNGRDAAGYPPLVYAMAGKQYGAAQALIDGGADVNAEVEPGVTLVDMLDREQLRDAGDWLVARGAHRKPSP